MNEGGYNDSQEYLQGKVAALELLCTTLVRYFFSLQTDIVDNVELRMITAHKFREMTSLLKLQNIGNAPFCKGFSDALDQFADKSFET